MNRVLAYILAVSIFCTSVHFGELLKGPQLMTHYREHQLQSTGLTFFQFLEKHYAAASKVNTPVDKHRHDRLPFHSVHHFAWQGTPFLQQIARVSAFTFFCTELFLYEFNGHPVECVMDIWQPPQLV